MDLIFQIKLDIYIQIHIYIHTNMYVRTYIHTYILMTPTCNCYLILIIYLFNIQLKLSSKCQ